MKPASHHLAAGLRSAGRRFHYVLLDLVFQGAFGVIALTLLVLAFLAFLARAPVDAGTGAALATLPPPAALAAVRSLVENGDLLARWLIGAGLASMLIWTVGEALVRGGLLPETRNTLIRDAFAHFPLYLMTGALRRFVLLSVGIVIGLIALGPLLAAPVEEWGSRWPAARWPVVAGACLVGLSAGHSFLLLARYSAIGTMRRDP